MEKFQLISLANQLIKIKYNLGDIALNKGEVPPCFFVVGKGQFIGIVE